MIPTLTRRTALSLAGAGAAGLALGGCGGPEPDYDALVAALWGEQAPPSGDRAAMLQALVFSATLAANGHNTQPWRFGVSDRTITIRPDLSRRTPVVDPDDHHLFASLGCAAENLVIAAEAAGLSASIEAGPEGVLAQLDEGPAADGRLFRAIARRQSVRLDYDGRKADAETLTALAACGQGYGVEVRLFESAADLEALAELVVAGSTAQCEDPAFVRELRDWIRFNPAEAARTRDGLFTGSSGNPIAPGFIGRRVFPFAFKAESENAKYVSQIRSSAGLALLVADRDDPAGWTAAGRACQRFALEAAARGLKTAFINPAIEVTALRPQLASFAGVGARRPNLLMRFGYGPDVPRSLRRPVAAVIEAAV